MTSWWQSMNENWKPLDEKRWRPQVNNASLKAANPKKPNKVQRFLIKLIQASFLHRGLFRPFLSRCVFGLGSPLQIEFRGVTFLLSGSLNLIEQGLLLHPNYNKTDIDFLESALFPGATMIDIGSNIGLYSLPLSKIVGPTGKVIAIDANPQMAQLLGQNARLSQLSNITILSVAVSDTIGHAKLAVRKNDDAIVRINEQDDGEISVTTLNAIVTAAGLDKIDALKIDIEGHEDKALAPFIEIAPEKLLPKRIVIEWNKALGDYPACAAAFALRGYTLVGRTRNNSLYSREQ